MAATAQAQPNIALVKYWGKQDTAANVPAVPSLSVTLDSLWTRTRVRFHEELTCDELSLNGDPDHGKPRQRVSACLDRLRRVCGRQLWASVDSENNFPTGAGLASSASGFAALVTAACSALGADLDPARRSSLARQSSGSAARSIFGGFVELALAGAPDPVARPLLNASEWPLTVLVAVTSTTAKATGSSTGMTLTAASSDYYGAWVDTAEKDFAEGRAAIMAQDFEALASVSERSCLKMHGLMLSAQPGLIYWNGATVECLHRIRELRRRGTAVFFTVDAGPQVKALCLPESAAAVQATLSEVPGVSEVLESALGAGARVIDQA